MEPAAVIWDRVWAVPPAIGRVAWLGLPAASVTEPVIPVESSTGVAGTPARAVAAGVYSPALAISATPGVGGSSVDMADSDRK